MKIPKRRKLSKEERMKVYEKCKGYCAYCGCALEYKDMQVDHVNPIRCGGEDDISNMLPACRSCNHYKSALKPEEFRKYLSGIPKKTYEGQHSVSSRRKVWNCQNCYR